MQFTVIVVTAATPPVEGTPVVVEVRDTSLMDVAAFTVDRVDTSVCPAEAAGAPGPVRLCAAGFDVPDDLVAAGALTVFAHVAAAGTEAIALGDLMTVQSYPVPADVGELVVEVVRVG